MENWIGYVALAISCMVAGIFLYFSNGTENAKNTASNGRVRKRRPHVDTASKQPSRNWAAVVADARKAAAQLQKPSVALDMTETTVGASAHSSIGGAPSLPPAASWPVDDDDKPMIFLAQINYADMPHLEGYPDQGVLSFFVKDDDFNGCDFPSLGNRGFHVVYHAQADGLVRREPPKARWQFSPLSDELTAQGRPLRGHVVVGHVSPNSWVINQLTADWYPDCPVDLWDDFTEELVEAKASPLYYGGHPDFTQQDFRRDGDDPDYAAVLLQLGYLDGRDDGAGVCWGDAGEACFLATQTDLQNRRFDKVAYNWDCC